MVGSTIEPNAVALEFSRGLYWCSSIKSPLGPIACSLSATASMYYLSSCGMSI